MPGGTAWPTHNILHGPTSATVRQKHGSHSIQRFEERYKWAIHFSQFYGLHWQAGSSRRGGHAMRLSMSRAETSAPPVAMSNRHCSGTQILKFAVVGAHSLAVLQVRREPVLPEPGCSFKLGHLPRARNSRENPEFDTAQRRGSGQAQARLRLYMRRISRVRAEPVS